MNTKTATSRKEYLKILKAIAMLDGEVHGKRVVGEFKYNGDWIFSNILVAIPGVRKVDILLEGRWVSVPWKDATVEIHFSLEG